MRWIPAALMLTSLSFAAVPYTLPIGVPAKASQVNRNFETLDSLIGDQIDQYTELRQTLVAQMDSLRKDLDHLRGKVKADSQRIADQVRIQIAADTGWKALDLPKGTVIGLLASAGPDGFLPGSDKIWQQVEAFGGIDGLPSPVAASIAAPAAVASVSPAAPAPDSSKPAKAAGDSASANPAPPVATPAASAPVVAAASPTAPSAPVSVPAAAAPVATKPVIHWFVKVK